MSENIFQILLLLSYLNIALISITIAVYTISVSYLGRETSRSISRRKRRVTELRETLAKLTTEIKDEKAIDAVQNEIAYYKKQQQILQGNLLWLSAKGAVYTPTIFFSVSLLLSVFGILKVLHPEILLAVSTIFVVIGALCLGKALKATERASLEIPKPAFKFFFESTEFKTKRCKVNKPTRFIPIVHNVGDERSEKPLLVTYFPKDIEVVKKSARWKEALMLSKDKREFGISYSRYVDIINIDQMIELGEFTVVAKQTGKHKLIISVKDKSGKSTNELILEVD